MSISFYTRAYWPGLFGSEIALWYALSGNCAGGVEISSGIGGSFRWANLASCTKGGATGTRFSHGSTRWTLSFLTLFLYSIEVLGTVLPIDQLQHISSRLTPWYRSIQINSLTVPLDDSVKLGDGPLGPFFVLFLALEFSSCDTPRDVCGGVEVVFFY